MTLAPKDAFAQRAMLSPTGGKGQLNIDQIAGYRIGTFTGVSYSGILGFSYQKYTYDIPGGTVKDSYTTFWLAPALDYFVVDHFSIGGFVEVSSTSGSRERPVNTNVRVTDTIPTATNFTILPRLGYMIAVGDRFGIWPRGGLGYASRQQPIAVGTNNPQKETFSSVIVDFNCPFLFRINETFYLSGTPDLTFGLGGTHETTVANGTRFSADGSFLQFGIIGGFGVLLDL